MADMYDVRSWRNGSQDGGEEVKIMRHLGFESISDHRYVVGGMKAIADNIYQIVMTVAHARSGEKGAFNFGEIWRKKSCWASSKTSNS